MYFVDTTANKEKRFETNHNLDFKYYFKPTIHFFNIFIFEYVQANKQLHPQTHTHIHTRTL